MDNKERILETSFKLFLEKGFTDVSINDVIKVVGLTKGGFYYYFESKETLLFQVIDRFLFSYLDARLTLLREEPGTPQTKIERFFFGILNYERGLREAMHGFNVDFRSFYLLQMEGVKKFPRLREQFRLFQATMRKTIETILEEGKVQGMVAPNVDSLDMAFHIVGCGEGLLLQWVVNPDMDVERMIKSSCGYVSQCLGKG